jgi:hypothetical protein
MKHIVSVSEETIALSERYVERAEKSLKRAHDEVEQAASKRSFAEMNLDNAILKKVKHQKTLDTALTASRKILYGQDHEEELSVLKKMFCQFDLNSDPRVAQRYYVDSPFLAYAPAGFSPFDVNRLKIHKAFKKITPIDDKHIYVNIKTIGKKVVVPFISFKNIQTSYIEKKKREQSIIDMFTRTMVELDIDATVGRYEGKYDTDFVQSELFKLVLYIVEGRRSESVILFTKELLLEIGVNIRGVRRAIETIGRTLRGQIEDSDEMIFSTEDDIGRTILNPLTFRSDGRFCAVAQPLEALEALCVVLPGAVRTKLKEFVKREVFGLPVD